MVDNWSTPSYLAVRLKASKTDPFRQGVLIYLGQMDTDLCPVTAFLRYMVQQGASDGLLFKFHDGRYLTKDWFVSAARLALVATGGVNPPLCETELSHQSCYHYHEPRPAGLADKTLGQWESSVYTLYICTLRETLCTVSRSLASDHWPWDQVEDSRECSPHSSVTSYI